MEKCKLSHWSRPWQVLMSLLLCNMLAMLLSKNLLHNSTNKLSVIKNSNLSWNILEFINYTIQQPVHHPTTITSTLPAYTGDIHSPGKSGLATSVPFYFLLPLIPEENLWGTNSSFYKLDGCHFCHANNSIKAVKKNQSNDFNQGKPLTGFIFSLPIKGHCSVYTSSAMTVPVPHIIPIVLLRPPTCHRHRGGWLILNQHCHRFPTLQTTGLPGQSRYCTWYDHCDGLT